tara:strand:- start:387914 stop:389320 length:1407 start_codon:yes stop_codon:yes gene_type:complete
MILKKIAFSIPLIFLSQSASALTLPEALESTLEANPTLASQRELTKQFEQQEQIDLGYLLPEVSAVGSVTVKDERKFGGGTTVNNSPKSYGLLARQPLFMGGEYTNRLGRSENLFESAEATMLQTEQDTLLLAAEAYLNVMLNQRILELNNFQVDVLSKQLEAADARFELGEVTKTDVSQAQARLAVTRAAAVAARGNLITSKAVFREIVGLEAEDLSWPEGIQFDPPADIEEALDRVLNEHPQVVAAQKNVDAEKHGVRQARSSFMPDVTAEARINRVEDGVSFQGNGSIDEVSLVVNAEFPLFRGGRTVGEVKQALATRREAENNLHAARRLVQRELVDAFNNYQTVRAELISREEAVRANLVAYDGVSQESLLGARTTLDLLDAEQELLQARVDEVTARHGKLLSTFRLLSAMGHLTGDQLAAIWPQFDSGPDTPALEEVSNDPQNPENTEDPEVEVKPTEATEE